MALITRAEYKASMGIPSGDTTHDALHDALIAHVDAAIKRHLRQNIESATYTEFYSGDGTPHLFLRQLPVTGITSIHVRSDAYWTNANFTSDYLLTEGTDYAVQWKQASLCESGIVRRIGNVWPGALIDSRANLLNGPRIDQGNIKVVYTAGYATVPSDIKWAAIMSVKQAEASIAGGGPVMSESHEYYSYTLASASEVADRIIATNTILAKYRRPVFG